METVDFMIFEVSYSYTIEELVSLEGIITSVALKLKLIEVG